jgi:hypothetical protein
MPARELNILFTSTTDSSRTLLEGLLHKHDGTLVNAIGKACLCVFENPSHALEAARELKAQAPQTRAALTRGVVSVSATSATGEAANLAAQLEGLATPGDILASEAFVQGLRSGPNPFHETGLRQFKGIPGVVKVFAFGATTEKDAKDLFDFARVEQERALDAKTLPKPDFKANRADAPIPFAVEPTRAPRVQQTPSVRALKKEDHSRALKRVLVISFFFVVVIPAGLLGGWWLWGTLQQKMVQTDEEVRKGVESSDVLNAIQTKRPKGATARQIAEGSFQTYGTLLIETSPSAAEVYVNDQRIAALTPVKMNQVEARTPLHVVIRKAGYRDHEEILSLLGNEAKKLKIRLEKSP